jgi:hypothetical protein
MFLSAAFLRFYYLTSWYRGCPGRKKRDHPFVKARLTIWSIKAFGFDLSEEPGKIRLALEATS